MRLFFAVFLLLATAIGQTQAAAITATEHGVANVESGDIRFEAAVFYVHFDDDVALGANGPTLSSLPLRVSTTFGAQGGPSTAVDAAGTGDGGGIGMPDAMFAQAGVAELRCPCPGCAVRVEYPECDTSQCVYPSDMAMGPHGAPRGLMPMPAIRESASALFSIFAGALNETAVVPLPATFIGIKLVREYDSFAGTWQRQVPPEVDTAACTVHFTDGALRWATSNTTFSGALASGVPAPYSPPCDPDALASTISELDAAIEQLSMPVESRMAMERRTWNIASFQLRDAWLGCAKLIDSLVVRGQVTRTTRGTRTCYHEPHTAEWAADPCCNHGRSFTECCAARTQTHTEPGLVGISGTAVAATCATPPRAEAALRALVRSQSDVAKCDARAREMGADWEVTRDLMRFVDTCYEELFGRNGPPTCISDDNCYTSCDKQRGECVQPHDNPDPYLLECFTDHINEQLERVWRRDWGLTGQSSKAEFAAALQSHLYQEACVGPTAWQHNEHWESAPVESCDAFPDDPHCHCWTDPGAARAALLSRTSHPQRRAQLERRLRALPRETGTQCWRSWLVPANQTACLADQRCNWDRQRNATECTDPALPAQFCGECHAGECWPVTQPAMCFTWVESPAQCTAQGGEQGPWGPWHCVFPALAGSEEQCLPAAQCGARPDIETDKEGALGQRWCPAVCASTFATNETQCAAEHGSAGAWWDAANGRCVLPLWGQQCTAQQNTTWFPGRSYQPGQFTDQPTCEAGRCSIDPRMSAAQCAAHASCTKPCAVCRARDWGKTLCYNAAVTQSVCEADAGVWDAGASTCLYDALRSASECTALNATNVFESCEALPRADCAAETGLSAFAQARLECYVNNWDVCPSQAACEATGVCDDWDFQNWHNPQCWNGQGTDAATQPQCVGACVTPFSLARGWPECDYGAGTVGWSRLGCVNYDVLDAGACAAVNGTWHTRAFDAASCAAHGTGCSERNWWQLTPKQGAACTGCGGTPQPYYRWNGGAWITGEMVPLTWTTRAYASINAWQPTLNWELLRRAVERVAMQVVARGIKSAAQCRYNAVAATLRSLACDCGTGDRTGCFTALDFVPIGEQEFFSGIGGTAAWANVAVRVGPDAVPSAVDSAVVDASATAALILTTADAKRRRRAPSAALARREQLGQRSPYDPNEYEVVTNHLNYIVGQLLGNGVTLTLPGNLTEPVLLCIDVDQDIPRDPEMLYPVADFAGYNASYYGEGQPKWWPLGLDVTVVGDYVQLCANVTESGTFFPALRLADWETATGIATTTTTTTTTATTTTASPTTTAAPTAAPLGAGVIVAISIAALLGMVVAGALISALCFGRNDGYMRVSAQMQPSYVNARQPVAVPVAHRLRSSRLRYKKQ